MGLITYLPWFTIHIGILENYKFWIQQTVLYLKVLIWFLQSLLKDNQWYAKGHVSTYSFSFSNHPIL